MFHMKHRKEGYMYTLEKVLYLVNAGTDVFCEINRSDRFITNGYLSDLDLKSDTKIEMYRMDYDVDGDEYLVLFLA